MMQRLQLRYHPEHGAPSAIDCLDVPDITTALVVAEIVASDGSAEIWDGDRRLAGVSRCSQGPQPLWQVD